MAAYACLGRQHPCTVATSWRSVFAKALERASAAGVSPFGTSIFFKRASIYRLPDVKRNVLVYIAASSKIINGSPANSIDVVPILPWPEAPAKP